MLTKMTDYVRRNILQILKIIDHSLKQHQTKAKKEGMSHRYQED
jgi:hypothetical protein